jgi:hypothetical protein
MQKNTITGKFEEEKGISDKNHHVLLKCATIFLVLSNGYDKTRS